MTGSTPLAPSAHHGLRRSIPQSLGWEKAEQPDIYLL